MAHDTHFLVRLSRISVEHTELALSLYRDPELVREIFSRSLLPDSAERVAVSLADPVDGPFIVLARNGKFVTCLGVGMRASDLPLITREKLDSVATQLATLRERLEAAAKASGVEAVESSEPLLRKLFVLPEELSAEDVQGLRAWLPMTVGRLVSWTLREQGELRMWAGCMRDRSRTPKQREAARLLLGKRLEAVAAATQILLYDAHRWLPSIPASRREPLLASLGLAPHLLFCQRSAARYLNGVAGAGKLLLPQAKEWMRRFPISENHFILDAIGQRNPKLRTEIAKAIARSFPLEELSKVLARWKEREAVLVELRRKAVDLVPRNVSTLVNKVFSVDKLMSAVWASELTNDKDVASCEEGRARLRAVLASFTQVEPEALYLPADVQPRLDVGRSADVFAQVSARLLGPVQARKESTPKRNEPCACGSGRKYKKCCRTTGRTAEQPET